MSAWFTGLGVTAKALMAVGIIAVALVAGGVRLGGWDGLPARVTAHDVDIAELHASSTSLERKVDDILCILKQPEGANPLDCVQP